MDDNSQQAFRIGITGDVGRNLFTHGRQAFTKEQAEAYQPYGRGTQQPHVNLDIPVSSGAALTHIILEHLFDKWLAKPSKPARPAIKISSFFPQVFPTADKYALSFSTIARSIYHIKQFPSDQNHPDTTNDPYRIQQVLPLTRIDVTQSAKQDGCYDGFDDKFLDAGNLPQEQDLFIITDAAGRWRNVDLYKNSLGRAITSTLDKDKRSTTNTTRLIVNCSLQCPTVERPKGQNIRFVDKFWSFLDNQENKQRICVICSANVLRHGGAILSRHLSVEQTVEDLVDELKHFAPLEKLSSFGRLIVRFGTSFAVCFDHTQGRKRSANLVFSPSASELNARDADSHGRITGKNTLLIAAIAREAAQTKGDILSDSFCAALQLGLAMGLKSFKAGFGKEISDDGTNVGKRQDPFRDLATERTLLHGLVSDSVGLFTANKIATDADADDFQKLVIPAQVVNSETDIKWEILRDQVDSKSDHRSKASRLNLAVAIARYGVNQVLNRSTAQLHPDVVEILERRICVIPRGTGQDFMTLDSGFPQIPGEADVDQLKTPTVSPVFGPVLKVGNLASVERLVIENIRGVRSAIVGYSKRQDKKPLSIAIFGPPGSGKSFAIKEIIESINADDAPKELQFLEYNLSQLSNIKELGHALHHIGSVSNENRLPVVFFDEFDCVFDGQPLGWLKYFLAPMQDGQFYDATDWVFFGRAVFIFAGGIFSNFKRFISYSSKEDPGHKFVDEDLSDALHKVEENLEDIEPTPEFRAQKGPDFVSRLRGYFDILPLNGKRGDEKPVVRRAVLLRGIIEAEKLLIVRNKLNTCVVHEDLLYAMLTVDRYRHGARSMAAVLKMCAMIDGQIENASLPSRAQLNMHVNAKEFFIRMQRSRFRRLRSVAPETDLKHTEDSRNGQGNGSSVDEIAGMADSDPSSENIDAGART